MLFDTNVTNTNETGYSTTPLAYIGSYFGAWRGDIIFRFKFVCTKFHTGRVRIHWDPKGDQSTVLDPTNVVFTKIVDLSKTDEVEFRVPYMQALPWLYNRNLINSTNWSVSVQVTPIADYHNGVLTMRILNNLSAPIDTAPINVLIFVRGAENFEFANPQDSDNLRYMSQFRLQSRDLMSQQEDERYLLNWGEPITSLRPLMRRSHFVDELNAFGLIPNNDAMGSLFFYFSRLPPAPGYDPNGLNSAKGVVTPGTYYPYTYTAHTPLDWFSAMFVAMRGSIRWHYNINSDPITLSDVSIRRLTDAVLGAPYTLQYSTIIPASLTGVSKNTVALALNTGPHQYSGSGGIYVTNTNTQTGISFEAPMMTCSRFAMANPLQWVRGIDFDGTSHDTYIMHSTVKPSSYSNSTTNVTLSRYVGIGSDFNLHFFLCTPVLYYNVNSGNAPQ